MSALTTVRVGSLVREVTRDKRPLAAGAKVYQGALAVAIISGTSRGYYKQGAAGEVSVAVGRFTETVDNTGGLDGAVSAEIHFFRERHLFLLDNDTGTALTVADRESACWVLDDHTVTGASASNGEAGRVYDVTSEGVWVEIGQSPPQELSVPNIQTGTSTLVSGTKTITGVTLTSTSRITATMKDPGSGAITGFAALDIPVGSRTAGAAGTGSFVVNAIDDSKAVITTAVSTFDWQIVG